MDPNQQKIVNLIYHYMVGDITSFDEKELKAWISADDRNRLFFERVVSGEDFLDTYRKYSSINREEAFQRYEARISKPRKWYREVLRYAAILFLPIAIGITIWALYEPQAKSQLEVVHSRIAPGGMKAILSLSDGKKVYLTKDSMRIVSLEQPVHILNSDSGIVYVKNSTPFQGISYNTLETPRGGEYKLTLSDGTIVHLNAESQLRYPVSFFGEKREVFLTGEAYFEVAKDSIHPFYVKVNDIEIKVYGTSFNVNSYDSGVVKTTLVDGKIGLWMKSNGKEVILEPNQMAEYHSADQTLYIQEVYAYNYIAWRYGEFVFDKESLEEIMEKLSMWYDIQVVYANKDLKKIRFTGIVNRFVNVEDVLSLIEATTSVDFEVYGNVIIVKG